MLFFCITSMSRPHSSHNIYNVDIRKNHVGNAKSTTTSHATTIPYTHNHIHHITSRHSHPLIAPHSLIPIHQRKKSHLPLHRSPRGRRAQRPHQRRHLRLPLHSRSPRWKTTPSLRVGTHGHDHGTGRRGGKYGIRKDFGCVASPAEETEERY